MGTEEWSRASCSAVTLPSKLRVFYVTDKPGRAFLKLSVVKPGLESAPPPSWASAPPWLSPGERQVVGAGTVTKPAWLQVQEARCPGIGWCWEGTQLQGGEWPGSKGQMTMPSGLVWGRSC